MFNPVNTKENFPQKEEEIIKFWQENKSFQKSIDLRNPNKNFIFYDGPPFATGLPHYGHILAGTIKDVIPRYKTMRGYQVKRRFGWDCHGLPVENLIEKELNLLDRNSLAKYGEDNFNEACRESVLRYTSEWEKFVTRMGRWVDFKKSYKTMDAEYMESIWWVFGQLWQKNLVYKGLKPMHVCPRCVTPLSNFEVSQGYLDLTDFSVTIKFLCKELDNTYFLAWTTTPWTLGGNAGLAVNPQHNYVQIKIPGWKNKEGQILYKIKESEINKYEKTEEYVILAQELLKNYVDLWGENPKIIKTFTGQKLVDQKLTYEPLFDYYQSLKQTEYDKAYRLVLADFVSLEAGTGIVHIAPAFGEDDLVTGKKENLPVIQHVKMDGTFDAGLVDYLQKKDPNFKNIPVKDNKDNRRFDEQLIKILEKENKILKKENIRHSYPTCWRCETPLLNYGTSSWFIKVEELKSKLLKNNKTISWVPEHLKNGRFGKWLENARDWAVSRNRYWGTPLPVWECSSCNHVEVVDAIEKLEKNLPLKNKYFFMRHGQAKHNVEGIVCSFRGKYPLTKLGQEQALKSSKKAKELGINLIISSPVLRAQETAEIVQKEVNCTLEYHEKLKEWNLGDFEDKPLDEWYQEFPKQDLRRVTEGPPNGESLLEVAWRMKEALAEIEDKYEGKKILIISHSSPLVSLKAKLEYLDNKEMLADERLKTGEIMQFDFNHGLITDLHKHKIDHIKTSCPQCSKSMSRIKEVFDCWFESGAMPYAEQHFPFNMMNTAQDHKKTLLPANLPADFIAEGLDQTRGWFYTLHVISTGLFDKPAFKNCVVNGIVLAEDGQKMSKSKQNYPDPQKIFDKYGADAMRFYLMNSPVTLAEDFRFSEKGVQDVLKNVLLPLWNSYSFLVTYANADGWVPDSELLNFAKIKNPLDIWIISELEILKKEITQNMDKYNLSKSTVLFPKFIDNLTNWYIIRSRRRFWDKFGTGNDTDKQQAYETLYYVLLETVQILAPFCPFITEMIYQNLTQTIVNKTESVHHCLWPEQQSSLINKSLSQEISIVQNIISLGLALRKNEKVKVRQPLNSLEIVMSKPLDISDHYQTIQEELNVKNLKILKKAEEIADLCIKPNAKLLGPRFGKKVQEIIKEAKLGNITKQEDGSYLICGEVLQTEEIEISYVGKAGKTVLSDEGIVISFDFNLTEELKQEGQARDLVRLIQEMRKEAGYDVSDHIIIDLKTDLKVLENFGDYILKETLGVFGPVEKADQSLKEGDTEILIKKKI